MRFRPTRRHLVIAGGVVGGLLVLGLLAFYVVYPRVGKWMVESKVVPKLEAKLGRDVTIGSIEIDHGHAVLRDVRVKGPDDGDEPLVRIDRIDVDFDFWASVLGDAKIGKMIVDGVAVRPRRDAAGVDNFRDVLARLGIGGDAGPDGAPVKKSGFGSMKPTTIEIKNGDVKMVDEASKVTATIESFEGTWQRGGAAVVQLHRAVAATTFGPAASASQLTLVDDPVEGRRLDVISGTVQLWPGMSLTGIAGSIAPADADRFDIRFEGGYGGVEGRLWTASGWLDPAGPAAAIDLDAARFTLDRLKPILVKSPVLDYEKASVDARLHVEVSGAAASFSGGFHLRDFTLGHPYLAEQPIPDLEIGGEVSGRFERASRTLSLDRAALSARGLPFELSGWLAMPGGQRPDGTRREKAALDMRLVIPKKPCQEVLEALPPEAVPYMQGFKLTGKFDTDLRVAIDWSDLEATVLDGRVGIFGCKPKEAPEEVLRLQEPFEHYVEVELDQWLAFMVGPENPDFVPITDVSPYLIKSLMTTEDSAFYKHRGFIVKEFRTALIKNLEAGYFKYGASSITMQLVKNALLYREKTASRKFQELFLTWYIETLLEKDRILEIYVNIIEYGPGLYGIGPAAKHYFGKHPRDLSPVEAAFFSSILPNPKERYAQYCQGTLRGWTEDKIQRILGLMRKRDRLTEEEYVMATITPLLFENDGTETEKECMDRRKKAMKNARSTNPLKKK
jgi:hypothetical protein